MTADDRDDVTLIVEEHCLYLDDRHAHIAECVNPDGTWAVWVLARAGEAQSMVGTPAHEELGPLPWSVQAAIDYHLWDPDRCGATTATGRPCRNRRGACQWHAAEHEEQRP